MPIPHVIILGGGFGGLAAARELRKARTRHSHVRVTLVDRTNHHTFQPLLYQVATAGLAPSDITVPIRWRLRHQRNTTTLMAEVVRVDPDRRVVVFDDGRELAYDYLIVATGARHAYFGHDEWEQFAPGLKSLDDARHMRQRFLMAFENAEKALDVAEQRSWLTIVVVGGGPTGVELAGSMPEMARRALRSDFRNIDTSTTRVILVEAGPRILPTFSEDLSRAAQRGLEKLGVEVRTGTAVTNIDGEAVWIGSERLAARTVFWAAGNVASPLGKMLGGETDHAGRVKVSDDLSVPAHPEIFVVGDLALAKRKDGSPAPAVAPTANQTGARAARNVTASIEGRAREPFRYFHKGDLATIGRHKAVAAFGKLHLSGYLTWFLWLFVHLMYLVGFRNRALVLMQWAWAYVTYQRGVRLIVGSSRAPDSPKAATLVATPAVMSAATSAGTPASTSIGANTGTAAASVRVQ